MATRKKKAPLPAFPRNADGRINNCALANGYPAAECQMCLDAKCPDVEVFAKLEAALVVEEPVESERGVKRVDLLAAARLLTMEPDDPAWSWKANLAEWLKHAKGALVRLRPDADVTEANVEEVRAALAKVATCVLVLPRPRADVVPQETKDEAPRKNESAREAVLALVEESNSGNRDELRLAVEAMLAEVKL